MALRPILALLTALLATSLATASAAADYRLLAKNQTNVWYLDAASIRRDGEVVSYDVLEIHHRHAPVGGRQPLYMLLHQQTRCEGRTIREVGRALFDTTGMPIFSTRTVSSWMPRLGEMGSAAFDLVCQGKLATAPRAPRGKSALEIAKADAADLAERNAIPRPASRP